MKKGFTLIELLVVISIIGLLSSIVVASVNSARVKARNTARNAEAYQLRAAFLAEYASTGALPRTAPDPASPGHDTYACIASSCSGGWNIYPSQPTIDAYIASYLTKPADPRDTVRPSGGFIYYDPLTWGGAPGWPAGYYIEWLLEPGTTDCGPGRLWNVYATYTECDMLLAQ